MTRGDAPRLRRIGDTTAAGLLATNLANSIRRGKIQFLESIDRRFLCRTRAGTYRRRHDLDKDDRCVFCDYLVPPERSYRPKPL